MGTKDMKEDLLTKQKKINYYKAVRTKISQKIKKLNEEYIDDLNNAEHILDFTAHAIVRHLERKQNVTDLFGDTDADKVNNYLSNNNIKYDVLLERILPREKQEEAVLINKLHYYYKDLTYIIKDFKVITIINENIKKKV